MSWIFSGSNSITFSGKDGAAQYVAQWESYGKPKELPLTPGSNARAFVWQGFAFIYQPSL